MGMFDSVIAKCPHCDEHVELQSKAGACTLETYPIDRVPVAVANDLKCNYKKYNLQCDKCGGKYRFKADSPRYVYGELIKEEDYIGNDDE